MIKLSKNQIIFLIIIALSIGAIYFLPNILVPRFYSEIIGGDYSWRDMAFSGFEEAFSYGVSISDIMRGNFWGGDPFLWEYKDMPTNWDYYPIALMIGLFFKLIQLSDPSMLFVIGDFIFPPISFIIIFFLFFRITKIFLLSILSSLIFLYFPSIFIFKKILTVDFYEHISLSGISNIFTDIALANANFSRLFVPALTMIFLSNFLLLLYYSISEKAINKKWLVFAGISYGLLFYVYFYYWVFVTISLCFLAIFLFFSNKDRCWRALLDMASPIGRIVKIFLYGFAASIPYWIRFFALADNPLYDELTQRVGLLEKRMFIWPSGGYLAILCIFLLLGLIFFKRAGQNTLFFYALSFLASVPIVNNLQLIFGFNPQPDHWGSRITVYFVVFAVLVLFFWFVRRPLADYKKSSSLVLLAAIMFLLVIMSVGQITLSQNLVYEKGLSFLDKNIVKSFEWINKNTDANSVFLTDAKITRTSLVLYTHANVYLPHACLSLASNNEILERYREIYALYKVPAVMLKDFFEGNIANYNDIQIPNLDTDFSMFCVAYQRLSENGASKRGAPKSIINEFMGKYRISKPDIKNLKYRADYLFYGPYEQAISKFNADEHPELKLVYSNNSVKIYKISLR